MRDVDSGDTRLNALFSAIDSLDTSAFLGFLAEDARFRFGSNPYVSGHDAIRDAIDGFFGTIAGCEHRLLNTLQADDTLVCEGEVTYQRRDGSSLCLPFTNVFETRDDLIHDYKIYIDIAPLYAE